MKKILSTLKLATLLVLISSATLTAQQDTPVETQEKVIIITKTTDENGNVETEKIVKQNVNGIDVYNVNGRDIEKLAFMSDDANQRFVRIKRGDAPNRACLGVMIGQKETIENIDGEETITTDGASELGVPIIDIIEASGAEDAGLLKDDIITNINGQAVNSIQDVLDVLQPFEDGGVVTVAYLRDGQATEVAATLKACTTPSIEEIEIERDFDFDVDWDEKVEIIEDIEIQDDRACLGVMIAKTTTVENINGEETMTIEGGADEGVRVLNVIAGSGAEDAGLLKDDIIKGINGQSVETIQDVLDIIGEFNEGGIVSVDYLRDGQVTQVDAALKACTNNLIIKEGTDFEWHEEELNDKVIRVEEVEVDGNKERHIVIGKFKEDAENEFIEEEVIVEGLEDVDLQLDNSKISDNTLDLQELDVFPNPTDSKFTLQFTAASVATEILITDIAGKRIYQEELPDFVGEYSKVIDISKAAKGTLLLSIRQGNKVFTEKIILQ